jgi:hypothetical protein
LRTLEHHRDVIDEQVRQVREAHVPIGLDVGPDQADERAGEEQDRTSESE